MVDWATFISKFIKVATKCWDVIPQEVYIPSMWNFMASRGDAALSSLLNSHLHLETIPQHDGFEAGIMVCEISQYLSTKSSSSIRFFCNMELWKLCFPPENWVKMKSIKNFFKNILQIQNLLAPPLPPLLEVCFCYCKFPTSPYDGERGRLVLTMTLPLATWFWLFVFFLAWVSWS